MKHPEKRMAKSIDMSGRCRAFTDIVYSGAGDSHAMWREMNAAQHSFDPPAPEYICYIGEMHGHTNLSDGSVDIDRYFCHLRDEAKVDFAAITDHDHGGVGRAELWVGNPSKWDIIRKKVAEYDEPGQFTTILAYERDSYPFYNNMILYYGNHHGEMLRSSHDGEITAEELRAALQREDILIVPHDTYSLSSGADFSSIPMELMTPCIEIYSRGDAAEYMGNPANAEPTQCAGGFWQDALRRGARMGCIAGSDDHSGKNGSVTDAEYPYCMPGLTGIWAKANTLSALFEALKAKRCYGFMGERMEIDFRINGHWMGEEIAVDADEDVTVWYAVRSEAKVKRVTVVKNCREYAMFRMPSNLFFDYRKERAEDCYYLRVELENGCFGWTSPIWVRQNKLA